MGAEKDYEGAQRNFKQNTGLQLVFMLKYLDMLMSTTYFEYIKE